MSWTGSTTPQACPTLPPLGTPYTGVRARHSDPVACWQRGGRARRRTARGPRRGVRSGRRRRARPAIPGAVPPAWFRACRGPPRRLPGRLRVRDAAAVIDLVVEEPHHPAARRGHRRACRPYLRTDRTAGTRALAAAGHRRVAAQSHPRGTARGTGGAYRLAAGRGGAECLQEMGLAQDRTDPRLGSRSTDTGHSGHRSASPRATAPALGTTTTRPS